MIGEDGEGIKEAYGIGSSEGNGEGRSVTESMEAKVAWGWKLKRKKQRRRRRKTVTCEERWGGREQKKEELFGCVLKRREEKRLIQNESQWFLSYTPHSISLSLFSFLCVRETFLIACGEDAVEQVKKKTRKMTRGRGSWRIYTEQICYLVPPFS